MSRQHRTPITPIVEGLEGAAERFSQRLFEEGVFAECFCYPMAPGGQAQPGAIVTAAHSSDLCGAQEAFGRVGRELGRAVIGIDISEEYRELAIERAMLNVPAIESYASSG